MVRVNSLIMQRIKKVLIFTPNAVFSFDAASGLFQLDKFVHKQRIE